MEYQKGGWLVLVLVILAVFSCQLNEERHPFQIIGYYPLWKMAERDTLVAPVRLPYEKLTIINVAFFYPTPEGRLVVADTLEKWVDPVLRGTLPDGRPAGGHFGSGLVHLAHQNGVRVLPSIGGWANSADFPALAASDSARRRFAAECMRLVRRYDLDGIDIDWEYPGYIPHNGTPADRQNFTLLLRTLRDSLDALEKETGRKMLLTAALPADTANVKNLEVRKIAALLDFLNIMTYDLSGAWMPMSNHHAPLYALPCGDTTRSVDAAFRLYVRMGAPPKKLNLGVPFYGRSFADATGPCQPHRGSAVKDVPSGGVPEYWQIMELPPDFVERWDSVACVPFRVSEQRRIFITYDNPQSVRLKAEYVRKHGAGGLIIWQICGDYMEDGSTPLLETIARTFAKGE